MASKSSQLIAMGFGILVSGGDALASQAALVPVGSGHSIEAKDEVAQTTWYVDAELIHLLEKEASRKVSAYIQAKGRLSVVDVKVSINMKDRMIIADVGKGFLPKPDEGEVFFQELAVTLRYLAEQTGLSIIGVDFYFQGKPLKHYYPEELSVPPLALR